MKPATTLIWLIPVALLLVALAPLPYGYYTLLRLVVTGASGYLAYRQYEADGRAGASRKPWMKYREFERILLNHGFTLARTRESHKQFRGVVDGVTRLVTLDYSQPGEDILPRNLKSMVRQPGLSEQRFRKR